MMSFVAIHLPSVEVASSNTSERRHSWEPRGGKRLAFDEGIPCSRAFRLAMVRINVKSQTSDDSQCRNTRDSYGKVVGGEDIVNFATRAALVELTADQTAIPSATAPYSAIPILRSLNQMESAVQDKVRVYSGGCDLSRKYSPCS